MKRSRLSRGDSKKEKLSLLALEFSVLGQQIKDSHGVVKKELEKRRDKVVKQYRRLKGKL